MKKINYNIPGPRRSRLKVEAKGFLIREGNPLYYSIPRGIGGFELLNCK